MRCQRLRQKQESKGKNLDERECTGLLMQDGQAVSLLGVKLSGDLWGSLFQARVEQHFFQPRR